MRSKQQKISWDSTVKTSTDFNEKNWISQQYVCIYIIYTLYVHVYVYIYIYLHVDMYDWVLKRGTSNWHKLGIAMLPKMTRSAATKPVP